jgi:predicted SAM-dependent methyltransferase
LKDDLKINLGSGERPLPGFINVDALADAPGVDVVADISEPLPFEDGSAELIYAAHILEHFPTDQVPALLRDWRRVLRDGGQLLVAVPDLDVIARMLVERSGWFTPPHSPWIGAIFGGQKDAYDFHKTGFNAPWLAYLLNEAGFGTVRREERFVDIGVMDATVSPLPFGVNMSLNMRAIAGEGKLPALRPTPVERVFDTIDRALQFTFVTSTCIRARLMARRRRKIERAL